MSQANPAPLRALIMSCLALVGVGCVEDSEPAGGDPPEGDMRVDAAPPDPDMAEVVDASPPLDMRPLPDMLRPPPPGDPCAEPVDLNTAGMGMGGEVHYVTRLNPGPSALRGSCGGIGPEQALRFTAPAPGRWFFSTARPGTELDTVLYVQTACGQPGTEIACNDDTGQGGFQSVVAVDLEADQQVFVILDSFGREGGSVTLAIGQAGLSALGEPCDEVSRYCPEGTVCFGDRMARTCQAVRPRDIGEACDRQGRLGECVPGAVCYGFQAPICEAVRARQQGERCDPGGQLGACVEGTICYGFGDEATCEEVREREAGERCDLQGGIGPCAEGLACRRLGMGPNDTFCVEIEILPEGAICAVDGSAGECEAGTLCRAEGDRAPTCVVAEAACPADWPVVDLNASPGGRGWRVEGALGADAVETALCRNQGRAANVYAFTAETAGRHTFETLPGAGPGFDPLLDIRRFCGFVGPGSTVACDDDGGDMLQSRADVQLEEGETIFVLVGGIGGGGAYVLEVTGPGAP